tara:strand:- start:3 stop:221 length:219 start_codon:yes stop_codon:yes gene_type:complete
MEFSIGDKVVLKHPMKYLKTAENMPMLRPPDLVSTGEFGEIVGLRSNDLLAVRFRRGTFLIPKDKIEKQLLE